MSDEFEEGQHRIRVIYEDGRSNTLAFETQRSAFLMLEAMEGLVGQEGPDGVVACVLYENDALDRPIIVPGVTLHNAAALSWASALLPMLV